MTERAEDQLGRDRFARVEAIFAAVCDLGPDEREQRLAELCAGDDALADEVRALLAADEHPSPALTPGVVVMQAEAEPMGDAPRRVGGFEIVGVLGEGGMGIVYEAIQRSPRRPVALKVIRQRTLHARILRRFESEAQILGRLHHPGIATIYESGIADENGRGVPYVAMELVRGEPITDAVKKKDLPVDQRVELLRDVCDAAAHAHRAGVVHRDLKPSNILVDAEGGPHVLDFGIAVDLGIEQRTQLTQEGQLLGTLAYMAPEQLEPDGRAATAATDVYALGVIGAELMLGEHPYARFDSSMYDLVRSIRDGETTTLGSRERGLKGDLATIIGRAMAREPARRYADAGELRDDLERYLRRAPILARKPSTWYQFRRFSQRNPVLVGSVGAVMLIMAAALVVVTLALGEANRQRQLAEHDEHVKALVNEFLIDDLFATGDAHAGGDPDITLIDAMLVSSDGIGERFADAPEVEAEIRYTMGSQLRVMNRFDAARTHLERSVELSQRLGLPLATIVERRNELTKLYSDFDELELALAHVAQTEAMLDGARGLSPGTRMDTLVSRASLLFHSRRLEESAEVFERAIELGRAELPGHKDTLVCVGNLATVLTRLGRFDEALKLHKESVAHAIAGNGAEHPDTLIARDNLGLLYMQMGEYELARVEFENILATRMEIFGPANVRTCLTRSSLGRTLSHVGDPEVAAEHLTGAYRQLVELVGPEHRYSAITRGFVRGHFERTGQPDLAARYAEPTAP